MAFRGFPSDTLKYFKEIARNNKREWYLKNKDRYIKSVEEPARAFVEALNGHKTFRKLGLVGATKSPLFRMARDTRFSPNKMPYKIYNGFSLSRSGVRGDQGVFYFHIQPGDCFMCQGFWQPDPKLTTRFRLKAIEDPKAFQKLVRAKLELSNEDVLKRSPRGFETFEDEPLKSFLRRKSFLVVEPLKESDLGSSRLVEKAAAFALKTRALLDYGWPLVDRWRIEGGDVDFQEKLEKHRARRSGAASLGL